MKKLLSLALPAFALVACSGTSTVHVAINSDDTGTYPLDSAPPAPDLTTVQHVNVTITEVDVHVSGENESTSGDDKSGSGSTSGSTAGESADDVRGEDVADTDSEWHVASTTETTVDLMTVRATNTTTIADATVPSGKITQVRLKLKSSGDAGNGDDVISGAVVDADGSTCDLIVPHSAINPGLKIEGLFKAAHIANATTYKAVVNVPLKDSSRVSGAATCAFRLNPVIKLKSVETESESHSDSHQ